MASTNYLSIYEKDEYETRRVIAAKTVALEAASVNAAHAADWGRLKIADDLIKRVVRLQAEIAELQATLPTTRTRKAA